MLNTRIARTQSLNGFSTVSLNLFYSSLGVLKVEDSQLYIPSPYLWTPQKSLCNCLPDNSSVSKKTSQLEMPKQNSWSPFILNNGQFQSSKVPRPKTLKSWFHFLSDLKFNLSRNTAGSTFKHLHMNIDFTQKSAHECLKQFHLQQSQDVLYWVNEWTN